MSTTGIATGSVPAATEWQLSYGGDYVLTPTGDWAIVQDTPSNPAASIQRIIFLLFTNPSLTNAQGTGTTPPDDICFPGYGAGLRMFVGYPLTTANTDTIVRQIMSGLADSPFVSQNPAPTVTLTPQSDGSTLVISIQFWSVYGQPITLPDVILSPTSIQLGDTSS